MKRSFTEVTEEAKLFTIDELSRLTEIYQNTLFEKSSLATEFFFSSGGGDVFQKDILGLLTLQMDVKRLLKLRLVSKKWSDYILTVTHLNIDRKRVLEKFPFNTLSRVTSLELHPITLYNKPIIFPNITELHMTGRLPYLIGDNDISLLGWTSLKKLSIDYSNCFSVKGLSELTSLTSLSCDVKCFPSPQNIYYLTNLTYLNISSFPSRSQLSTRLPSLTHLVSCSPTHFIGFTGNGQLNTDLLAEGDPECVFRAKIDFDFHYPHVTDIECTGKWESGLFSGKAFFRLFEPLNGINRCLGGSMKNGKLDGNIREEDLRASTGSYGKWRTGKKHGLHLRYEWKEWDHSDRRTVMLENWLDGILITSEIP